MDKDIMIGISCHAYNHANYRNMLEGFDGDSGKV